MSFADKYVLEDRLGGGGMAEVFRGRTVGAGRAVAIKRVVEGLAEDPKFRDLFAKEAKLSAALDHPNIVHVVDFDRDDDGVPYIVMELVDGPTLDRVLETGPLPLPACIWITVEVLRGLGYAHEFTTEGVKGIVHRDVSPHNVLLSWEGAVKVSDFGIAKARAGTLVTASEMVKGKPAYMSPEQANADALDGRSDLFAVGVILWEMLAGRPLFSGGTTQETFAKLMFAEIPPPSALRAEVPGELDKITMRLLARERDDRYRVAQLAIADLQACRDHPVDGVAAMIGVLAERFTVAKRQPSLGAPRGAVSVMRTRAPRRTALVLTLAVLGLGIAMAVIAVTSSSGPPRAVARVAVADASTPDAGDEYDFDTSTPRGHSETMMALQETCRWSTRWRLIGIREFRPDGTRTPPMVMVSHGYEGDAPRFLAPKDLAQCIQRFMARVKTPPPEEGSTRYDEDYGFGTEEVLEPRVDP